jgi:uncharacterized protein (TIGR02231 family)
LGVALTGLLLVLPLSAFGAEIRTTAEPMAVTVFNDRARVTRTTVVSVPAGESTIVIEGLQGTLLAQSLRVEGRGTTASEIGSVQIRRVFSETLVREAELRLSEEIQALQDRRRVQDDAIRAAKLQISFIQNLTASQARPPSDGSESGFLDPLLWPEAWHSLRGGAEEAFEAIRAAEIAQRAIDRKMNKLQRELSQVRTGDRKSLEALVELSAEAAGEIALDVTYQIPGASWRPIYDARLDTESGALTLVQMAEVVQRSGEDWTDVALTLSTSRPSQGTAVASLQPWFVSLVDPNRDVFSLEKKVEGSDLDQLLDAQRELLGGTGAANAPAGEPEEAAVRPTAEAVSTAFATEYQIAGRSDVPADNATHRFHIARSEVEAKLLVRAVPKVAAQAYLQAAFVHQGDEPLLPGSVALYRDGAFLGNAHLPLLRPDEDFVLSYGIDDRVNIAYALADTQQSNEGLLRDDRRVERRFRITVTNHHDRPIAITVFDQLPVSTDEDIDVERLAGTQPTDADFEDRKGVLAWTYEYAPKEEREIEFGYAVTFPEKKMVVGLGIM